LTAGFQPSLPVGTAAGGTSVFVGLGVGGGVVTPTLAAARRRRLAYNELGEVAKKKSYLAEKKQKSKVVKVEVFVSWPFLLRSQLEEAPDEINR